jgi:outer membrane protein OmpA-like peptidoglycan-associated protein
VRIERHRHRRAAVLGRAAPHALDDLEMAAMEAVEVAERDGLLPSLARAEKLELRVGEGDIDLEHRILYFELGTTAKLAEIEIFSPDGELLHSGGQSYDEPAPGSRLQIGWPDLGSQGESFRLELKVTDSKSRWVTFQVIRFYLEVPHEEVEFASGKSAIPKAQEEKLHKPLELLKDAAAKYAKLMDVSLYVAGHTDTVGKAADNQALSERRAQAIADYFIANGLTQMPIFVRGFGEGALAVKTADNVPEPKNRRAMYIVSSFMPALQGPGEFKRIR